MIRRHCLLLLAGAMTAVTMTAIAGARPAVASSTVYKSFLVAGPVVGRTDPRVRGMVPDRQGYRLMNPGGAISADTATLTWRPADDAYAFLVLPGQNADDLLFKATRLNDKVILWQSASPAGSGDAARWTVFATIVTDGTIVPVGFKADALAKILKAHHASLSAAQGQLPQVEGDGAMGAIDGDADDIQAALAEAVADPENLAVGIMAVPVDNP